jgi:hypothetical protein
VFFLSLTLVGEEASILTIMHGVENLGSGFSSMTLLNDSNVFCIKHMVGRIDVLQCNRWGNVEFFKHYKRNWKKYAQKLLSPWDSSSIGIFSNFVIPSFLVAYVSNTNFYCFLVL